MRKTLFLFIFAISAQLFSQKPLQLTSEDNLIIANDSLFKYQVDYKSPGSLGRGLEWDFTQLDILDDNYLLKYLQPDSTDTTRLCGLEHRTRYYYRQQEDSIWAVGFENYTTQIDYSQPELKLKFPFAYGDTLYSQFEGDGIYSNLFAIHVKGYTHVAADAEGFLKLPNLQGRALRIHAQRHYTQIKTDNKLFSMQEADSLLKNNGDTLQMTLDTYSWYMKGIRYPVFESIKSTLHHKGKENKDTTVFYTSFYYTPEELPAYYDEPEIPEIEQVFTEASFAPNPVENNLNISYKLTQSAVVSFRLLSSLGQPLYQSTPLMQDEGSYYLQIPMSSLIRGNYTLYIHVDDMMMNRVVVKK